MTKLKRIISELDSDTFSRLRENLVKSKANNFLVLLENYRQGIHHDDSIMQKLEINKNSLYVLKSRLQDKIQESLTGDFMSHNDDLLKQIYKIDDICFNAPRNVAISFLKKLEDSMAKYDMHRELQIVYAALKRIHLFSDKYFHYSRQYNKQVALSVSLDKCEELLSEFNRILTQYLLSRNEIHLDKLLFLYGELANHFLNNPSRQIHFIKCLMELQLKIFIKVNSGINESALELILKARNILDELPITSPYRDKKVVIDCIHFEYLLSVGDLQGAEVFYTLVEAKRQNLLLMNCIANTSKFLTSEILFLQLTEQHQSLKNIDSSAMNYDLFDTNIHINKSIYNSIGEYYKGEIKNAAKILFDLLNSMIFKEMLHLQIELKLTLAFYYIKLKENQNAVNLLSSLQRKIKNEKKVQYYNVLNLIKLLHNEATNNKNNGDAKQKDIFTLFEARNTGNYSIPAFLINEIKKDFK